MNIKPTISLKGRPPKQKGPLSLGGPKITLKGIKKQTLDDENIPIEEHFLLRILHPETAAKLREAVRKREIPESLHIHFKEDIRKATFTLDETTLDAVLVDLPCIIESQKTLDNKQFYKIADISQVLFSFSL
jgi:transcription initiation factor TFIID subunit 7